MENEEHDSLVSRLDELLGESSMPEIIAALVRISRDYKDQLKREENSEYQGWAAWEDSLVDTLRRVAGDDEVKELLEDV